MVSNVSANSNKKCPANIRTASVQSPVLVSPISVAHRNKMLDNEGVKKGNNWMREQWVANLKKKSMANAAGNPGVLSSGNSGAGASNVSSNSGRATKSGNTGRSSNPQRSRQNNTSQQQHHQTQQQQTLIPPLSSDSHSLGEKDIMGLSHPSLFFNDLGCFEIESQSFTRLTPSGRDFDHQFLPPPNTNDSSLPNNYSGSSSSTSSNKPKIKPLLKKRTNLLALEVNQPKPRTPRRKLNCGNAFEDFDLESSSSTLSSTPQSFSSVGTPSNFNAEVSRMWGPELDFGVGSYVDTFLDLPTPKSAELPTVSAPYQSSSSIANSNDSNSHGQTHDFGHDDDLSFPKLIRTNSIEQEGLSHFFGQTTLGGESSSSHNSSDFYQQQMPRHPPAHHHQIKKNQIDLGSSSSSSSAPYSQAAMGAVDECFSKMMPSPHPSSSRRNSLLSSSSHLNHLFATTPRGNLLRTPRGPNGEYSFDYKNMPEFETLLDEYKVTDIDQELDSFYLDTMESFGGDFDLISN